MSAQASANMSAALACVRALVEAGVKHAVVSPGSRSTPLALAFDVSPVRVHVVLDERSAAFFALGVARGVQGPVVLLCTSGSALAHYLPAVMEAHHAGVPLVVLSADRPSQVQGWGAPQTTYQAGVFEGFVRWSAQLEAPEVGVGDTRYVSKVMARAVHAGVGVRGVPGPVHVNMSFREPLWDAESVAVWPEGRSEAPSVVVPEEVFSGSQIVDVLQRFQASERGVVVCGHEEGFWWDESTVRGLLDIALHMGWPVLCEPTSQVRFWGEGHPCVLYGYEALLREPVVASLLKTDAVLRFGAWPTSKSVGAFLEGQREGYVVHVEKSVDWRDPCSVDHVYVDASPASFVRAVTPLLCQEEPRHKGWLQVWRDAHDAGAKVCVEACVSRGLWEGAVAFGIAQRVPQGALLHVSSSMPVRDLDVFSGLRADGVRVCANRGVNGIDGLVSTALGEACGAEKPVWVLSGELSFLHDVGGLALAREVQHPVTYVVINNGGGGIFGFLPIAQHASAFERLFLTPQNTDLGGVCGAYGVEWHRVDTLESLWERVRGRSEGARGVCVLEVCVDRVLNQRVRQEVLAEASARAQARVCAFFER